MNQCPNCDIPLSDNDIIIWKCQKCGKEHRIKFSKIIEIYKTKYKSGNSGKTVLRCRECGIGMDDGNEKLMFKCKECGEVIKGNLKFFALNNNADINCERGKKLEKNEIIPANRGDIIVCPECGKIVDNTVETCPECGYPINEVNVNKSKKTKKSMINSEEQIVQKDKMEGKTYKRYVEKTNKVGCVFNAFGWFSIILGALVFFISISASLSATPKDSDIIMSTAIIICLGCLVTGFISLALGNILFLLENIRDRLNDMDI